MQFAPPGMMRVQIKRYTLLQYRDENQYPLQNEEHLSPKIVAVELTAKVVCAINARKITAGLLMTSSTYKVINHCLAYNGTEITCKCFQLVEEKKEAIRSYPYACGIHTCMRERAAQFLSTRAG